MLRSLSIKLFLINKKVSHLLIYHCTCSVKYLSAKIALHNVRPDKSNYSQWVNGSHNVTHNVTHNCSFLRKIWTKTQTGRQQKQSILILSCIFIGVNALMRFSYSKLSSEQDRLFHNSQRHIEHATAHTWERGWGWLVLNLCLRFEWNSYVDSKIVRFLRKMDGPSRNVDKANFSLKKKRKQRAAFGFSNTFYGPNGLPTSFHFFKFMHRGMYFC